MGTDPERDPVSFTHAKLRPRCVNDGESTCDEDSTGRCRCSKPRDDAEQERQETDAARRRIHSLAGKLDGDALTVTIKLMERMRYGDLRPEVVEYFFKILES